MTDSILYKLSSGKPNKFLNFLSGFAGQMVPRIYYRQRLTQLLAEAQRRTDYEEMLRRVDYYIKVSKPFTVGADRCQRERSWLFFTGETRAFRRNTFHTAYFLDQYDVTRYFPATLRWNFLPGDVYFTPDTPTVVKSRLLTADNTNAVLLKLDKLRHFLFVDDPVPFRAKQDRAIFRGKIRQSRLRTAFLERYFDHPLCDCGVVGRNEGCPDRWMTAKKTIRQHLDYKFIMAIEGNDVASNLKWVMSSNSVAVMPQPTCETWFMEGTLKPDYHYIEVRPDFADLDEKLHYYIAHPEEAEAIIAHAHEYVAPFRDRQREEILQLMVLQRYFQLSGQL